MEFKIKNFTIEKFNNDVNNSGNLTQKYNDWEEYRHNVSSFISDNLIQEKVKNIFVMGAGECNDVDLHFLTSYFYEVSLCDIDIESIDDGINRQKLDEIEYKKIEKIKADFTGLSTIDFFENLADMTSRKEKVEIITKYIDKAIKSIKPDKILNQQREKYDSVLVLPTYTQLAYTQIETLLRILYEYNIYQIDELNKILTTMHYTMPTIIDNYNKIILSLVKDNGRIFVLSDVLEITDDKTLENIAEIINDKECIREMLNNDCCEFGVMGTGRIEAKLAEIESKFEIWPFDNNKKYLVRFITGKK